MWKLQVENWNVMLYTLNFRDQFKPVLIGK
jgi:hypothetical protein